MELKRFVLTPIRRKALPIYPESIGINPNEQTVNRPHGYPHYHWLQTIEGKGAFVFDGQTFTLSSNSGILLSPFQNHTYYPLTDKWVTCYVTFNGDMVSDLLTHIGLKTNVCFQWEKQSPVANEIMLLISKLEKHEDIFGLHASTYLYQFLLIINNYAKLQDFSHVSTNIEKIAPLIDFMNNKISDPEVGLQEFSQLLAMSPRQLHGIFRDTFNFSPYAYFVHLRIKKAKQLLLDKKILTIKQVGEKVGFRSTSHFIASFRKIVGLTPEQFRQLQ
ncbi:AraC family transcriptional regulator [Aquibacillus rhizosphaerae]|uniref:AraC family transcriptional regulator n=1 Tax=Aquibacillus rhizosphaerae TaxID=3051431 RepID=A0ABT7KZT4_9BACI|nr:AraC family transcriptional regulator [Aquibacillus sp. LR5S19]MDL4839064.1 AraC family transcriptional regulator [Aquibacillus sp. LR5S19]